MRIKVLGDDVDVNIFLSNWIYQTKCIDLNCFGWEGYCPAHDEKKAINNIGHHQHGNLDKNES